MKRTFARGVLRSAVDGSDAEAAREMPACNSLTAHRGMSIPTHSVKWFARDWPSFLRFDSIDRAWNNSTWNAYM